MLYNRLIVSPLSLSSSPIATLLPLPVPNPPSSPYPTISQTHVPPSLLYLFGHPFSLLSSHMMPLAWRRDQACSAPVSPHEAPRRCSHVGLVPRRHRHRVLVVRAQKFGGEGVAPRWRGHEDAVVRPHNTLCHPWKVQMARGGVNSLFKFCTNFN